MIQGELSLISGLVSVSECVFVIREKAGIINYCRCRWRRNEGVRPLIPTESLTRQRRRDAWQTRDRSELRRPLIFADCCLLASAQRNREREDGKLNSPSLVCVNHSFALLFQLLTADPFDLILPYISTAIRSTPSQSVRQADKL